MKNSWIDGGLIFIFIVFRHSAFHGGGDSMTEDDREFCRMWMVFLAMAAVAVAVVAWTFPQ